MTRIKKNVMVCLDPENVIGIDEIRGLISRSAYINDMIGKEIQEESGNVH